MKQSLAKNLVMNDEPYQNPSDIQPEQYAYLVKRIAHHIMGRLPSSVDVEDLIQSGMIGLLEAAQKYDASKGASFETYAGIRIHGAIVDEMRRGDWVPRSVHKNTRAINQAIAEIEAKSGRDAKDSEIASYLGMEIEEYHAIAKDCSVSRLFSLDASLEADEFGEQQLSDPRAEEPSKSVTQNRMKDALAQEILKLPEREQLVISLYYNDEFNLKEIGEVLGVSESRVSQVLSQANARLRARLRDWRA